MHFPSLDGLRAIAAYTVVVSHYTNVSGIFGGALGFGAGQMGVMLFFIISGFLMGRLYAGREWTIAGVLDFYRKRAARVLPLFYLIVFASLAVVLVHGSRGILYEVTPHNIWQHLLFIQGSSVLWTIPVEVQFYAVFPLIWLACSRMGNTVLIWLAILAAFAFASAWRHPVLIAHLPFFLAGIALAFAPASPTVRGADLAFVAALAAYFLTMPRIFGISPAGLWDKPFYLLTSAALVWAAISSPMANRILGKGLCKALGDASYSAYLLHLPVLHLLKMTPLTQANNYVFLVVFLLLTALVSWVSFRYFETPTRRFISGRKASDVRSRRPLAEPGTIPAHRE
jgi:peptidoglycan/LPS O-acetylase OafA/YrhL